MGMATGTVMDTVTVMVTVMVTDMDMATVTMPKMKTKKHFGKPLEIFLRERNNK
jgi:hypothetical protein